MNLLELAKEQGLDPKKVSSTGGGEYHSSCPSCGGKDRFRLHPNKIGKRCVGSYACRVCEINGDTISFCIDVMDIPFEEAFRRAGVEPSFSDRSFLSLKSPRLAPIISPETPSKKWEAKALLFIEATHKRIWKQPEILEYLSRRGIPENAVAKYKLGWNPTDLNGNREDWGLEAQQKEDGSPKGIWLPKGLVIPWFDRDGAVKRLKIRRADWKEGDKLPKYIKASGGMKGISIIGTSKDKDVMIFVESELDAFAVEFSCGDFAFAAAVGTNNPSIDHVTDYLAQKRAFVLVAHDRDQPGMVMLDKLKERYPQAKAYPVPFGKDVGEAAQEGLNIRDWILQGLPEKFRAQDTRL
ncbi:primase-helicase zinc-binding domain-containing protein [Estrella lausannensis]|uniref:DNA primase n=1 Tax=Estrella lausannensis TaxID=483423 RepID=A0A0H5DS92_9BACT|nr:primase-helicase zinc-binding domain-containing protein [Estrella lausannensis]CRX39581.1 DNA primase [Estrella lausannensis]